MTAVFTQSPWQAHYRTTRSGFTSTILASLNGPIGKNQPASLTLPDHQLNGVAEISAGDPRILNLAGPLEIVPGDLQ
jgi:hypothetical protein